MHDLCGWEVGDLLAQNPHETWSVMNPIFRALEEADPNGITGMMLQPGVQKTLMENKMLKMSLWSKMIQQDENQISKKDNQQMPQMTEFTPRNNK